jgi:two-component system, sensor histidine kinase
MNDTGTVFQSNVREEVYEAYFDLLSKLRDQLASHEHAGSVPSIMRIARQHISQVIPFDIAGFLLVNLEDQTFTLQDCWPLDDRSLLMNLVDFETDQGTFSMALQKNLLVVAPRAPGQPEILLHTLCTRSRLMGMFIAVIPSQGWKERDLSLKMLELIFQKTAYAVENALLYHEIREHTSFLENQIKCRTEEYQAMAQSAREALQLKTEYFASMSHEIRTQMNGVVGFISLLTETALSEEQGEYVQVIQQSSDGLLRLINDILDLSKMESGHLDFDIKAFDFRSCLEDCGRAMRAKIEEKKLHFILEVADDLPQKVWGDQGRIRQVVLNLLTNAIKFTSVGSVRVAAKVLSHGNLRYCLQVEVQDTGVGISPQKVSRLFQPFSQGDRSTRSQYGGTGLGLVISDRIVKAMGGEITVVSQPGEGATFIAKFYLNDASVEVATKGNGAVQQNDEAKRDLKILVVEDDPINRDIAVRMLARLGYSSEAVVNGELALQACQVKGYDLLFMDIDMPVMNGVEATRAVRSSPLIKCQPWIVALTANVLEGSREKFIAVGMDDYLAKPILLADLQRILNRLPLVEKSGEPKKTETNVAILTA